LLSQINSLPITLDVMLLGYARVSRASDTIGNDFLESATEVGSRSV